MIAGRRGSRQPKYTAANRRRAKAMQIAWGDRAIVRHGKPEARVFKVPSQSGGPPYTVNLNRLTCGCQWWKATHQPCKHIEAARLFEAQEKIPLTNQSKSAKQREIKKLMPLPNVYPNQPWYDTVKEGEPKMIRELARCLGLLVPYAKNEHGRPRTPLGDLLTCAIVQAYDNKPSRKAIQDPELLVTSGMVRRPKAPATISLRFAMKDPAFNAVVKDALRATADAVRKLETTFSVDATVFRTPLSMIHEQRRGKGIKVTQRILTAKLFVAIGLQTLMVVSALVTDGDENDQNYFIPLMEGFQNRFVLDEVHGDAGFNAAEHFEAVHARGATAYLDFDIDSMPQKGFPHYNEMLELYRTNYNKWFERYRFRPLVETANKVIKTTLKRIVRARSEESRETELLLTCIAHNLCRLLMARKEFGIEIPFADDRAMDVIDTILGEIPEVASF